MINNTTIRKIILFAMLFICFSTSAIQNSTVEMITGSVAVLCSAISYKVMQEFSDVIHPAILIGSSSFITVASYYLLQRATPMGRIKRANALLHDVARHTLARVPFDRETAFFDVVQDVYLTDDLPLISAYNHLIGLIPVMHYALSLINKASAEVGKDVLLQEECDASLSRANKLFKNISDAIKRIRKHKDYLSQLTIYKENLLHEKQTIAQEQMASAHLQIAHAQQESALYKWLKVLFGNK